MTDKSLEAVTAADKYSPFQDHAPKFALAGCAFLGLLTVVVSEIINWDYLVKEPHAQDVVKSIAQHFGIAILAGALVGLVFDLLLVKSLVSRFNACVTDVVSRTDKLVEARLKHAAEKATERDQSLLNRVGGAATGWSSLWTVGVVAAHPKYGAGDFVKELLQTPDSSEPGDIRILNTYCFAPDTFLDAIREGCRQGRKVILLLGKPEDQMILDRVSDIKMADNPRDKLEELKGILRKDAITAEAIRAGRIELKIFAGVPTVALWGIGDRLTVTWLTRGKTSIKIPSIVCRVLHYENPKKASLGDELLSHFNAVFFSATIEDLAVVSR